MNLLKAAAPVGALVLLAGCTVYRVVPVPVYVGAYGNGSGARYGGGGAAVPFQRSDYPSPALGAPVVFPPSGVPPAAPAWPSKSDSADDATTTQAAPVTRHVERQPTAKPSTWRDWLPALPSWPSGTAQPAPERRRVDQSGTEPQGLARMGSF